ncbi:hypothetical protein AXI59_04310 [Bacillus nakamurai]|uniref:Spore coat protein n=1 Tax=Bacillus nakamurai TaxID=1793963 RepID=A0A150FA90_9BACI|nr:hypothetical protein [Bacillus nakamurai]KXZ15085.1 hypothetical protein AXI59_04310 [Bacillus nakamurai]KXZ21890.1 hypothetical protein AXI58_13235 [Bacillus nakamurai]MED1226777.1 hypothetical protein [Bacillus nakamurai]
MKVLNRLHETLELHELLVFKNLCLTKSATMTGLVQDDALKGILEQDAANTRTQIDQLKHLLAGRGEALE